MPSNPNLIIFLNYSHFMKLFNFSHIPTSKILWQDDHTSSQYAKNYLLNVRDDLTSAVVNLVTADSGGVHKSP
jgi:hypothetical protein